jgi:DNA-directed RNA polymerase subunit RPC12/RpoP
MWYIIIIGFLIIGIFFGTRLSCQNPKPGSENDNSISINSPLSQNDTIKAMFSKEQIDKKLKYLAETPPPQKLSFGAMCYKPAFESHIVNEYVCPVCGEKTVYKKGKDTEKSWFGEGLEKEINNCRREIENVKGIHIKLDESLLCKHCSPKIENPELCLLVNISGQSDTTRICNISYKDIQIIGEFLNDRLVHSGSREQETPLVNNIERIKELLGIK